MTKVKIYHCKCHNRPYSVCPVCGCQSCTITWPRCPRCMEIKRIADATVIRDSATIIPS